MAGMSKSFQARGEQWQRLAAYQEQQRMAALTAYVDGVIGGRATEPAKSKRTDGSIIVLVWLLAISWLILIGLVVWRVIYGG